MAGGGGAKREALILAAEQVNICPPSDKRLAVGAVVGLGARGG